MRDQNAPDEPRFRNEIDLPYVHIRYRNPIVYYSYKEGAELGFPEIRELIMWAEKLSGQKPYVTFADARMSMNITNEGKRMVANVKNMPLFRGTAVLVKNSIYKFAVNFLNELNKRNYPFRAFTSKEKAVEWLLSLPLE
jgi:hypothetical protein